MAYYYITWPDTLTIITGENCVLITSAQEFIEIAAYLFLIFTQSIKFYAFHFTIIKKADI